MTKYLLIVAALVTLSLSAAAQDRNRSFKSFEVVDHNVKDGPAFVFSEAYATSNSPVVISVAGRKLTNADRTNRVDLQKHWLSVNVPRNFEFQMRSLAECKFKRKGEYPSCDVYVFLDPATKKEDEYYIYVGNWP
ncbi:MAG: hypothetical protein ABL859_06660 [Methylotenera sp.]